MSYNADNMPKTSSLPPNTPRYITDDTLFTNTIRGNKFFECSSPGQDYGYDCGYDCGYPCGDD